MNRKILPYNKKLVPLAKKLRNNLTWGEARLWKYIKNKQLQGYDFDRQKPIDNYIVDFYCKDLNLVIEIDGSSHDETRYDNDLKRQKELEDLGLAVFRFTEGEVLNKIDDVLQSIENYINSR